MNLFGKQAQAGSLRMPCQTGLGCMKEGDLIQFLVLKITFYYSVVNLFADVGHVFKATEYIEVHELIYISGCSFILK